MRSFLIQLAKLGGSIALQHFRTVDLAQADRKGRSDYVSHVDRRVEDALATRIRHRFPDHQLLGEEAHRERPPVGTPYWVIDPIDGTTNFLRGLPGWAISIAFVDESGLPRHGVIYDALLDECYIGERGAGVWINEQRVYSSGCRSLDRALVACSLPFRSLDALDDVAAVVCAIQRECDDIRRSGCAALDLAAVATGRVDAYWELGIYPWDTAAGELLVRCGGGAATDFHGEEGSLLSRRSILAAASPALHEQLAQHVFALAPWLTRAPYVDA
ncbi:MAG: inositol monophosphatase family protein [Planctomycetota bacterium]|jgi:myo-inositol-1(or 4)-monophosphatase|nr:inositol monophosphatase family protein [Planctomycetota bacterium]